MRRVLLAAVAWLAMMAGCVWSVLHSGGMVP